jgi:ABC-2 type transport system ATP-binding protein
MIEVAHLERRFGAVRAVDDLSFRLEKGEVVGFLGPNGAGKTTTMRVLTGYLPATRAERLSVAGFDVLRQSLEVRRRIGYLPESVPLYREMRVTEMMRFQGRLHGMSRGQLRARVPEVLARVGVLDRERQLVGNLSRGLKQRVGLAVALLPEPEVLILDEPTSGLDPLQRREVRKLIRELAEEHTVLVSSHILAEIDSICPRVIILNEGRCIADGTREELVERFAGSGHVRLEAVVGQDPAAAARLLASLPGVTEVKTGERVGIHHTYEVYGAGDLREDVGALAMTKGWALRELSWDQPSLEQLFARLVLGGDARVEDEPPARRSEPAAAPALESALPLADPGPAPDRKVIYSLNPFDRGASRDLSKPVDVTRPPSTPPTDA